MNEYVVNIGGIDHTVLLTDEDAKAQGLKPVEAKAAPAPKNKAREAVSDKA